MRVSSPVEARTSFIASAVSLPLAVFGAALFVSVRPIVENLQWSQPCSRLVRYKSVAFPA